MTVEVARRTRRRAPAAPLAPEPTIAAPASYAIGELEQTVFDCPSCSRPLALGARRCPGCGTRLVNGVSFGKASIFIAAGLAVGLVLGGGGATLFGLSRAAAAAPAVAATASHAPSSGAHGAGASATPAASTTPSTSTSDPASRIPPTSRSALVEVIAANARFATNEAGLRAALAGRSFDASAVAQILRTVSADSVYAQQLADRVARWPASSAVGDQLGTYYRTVHDDAAAGLVASVQNKPAYRAAAVALVKLFAGMPALDAAVRSTALAAGVDLPAPGVATAP